MNKVSVLVEGYAREWGSSGWEASSSVVLIQTDKYNILCDPGQNLDLLSKGLVKKNLKYSDIDWVFLTHTHIDHSYSMACFPEAKVIDFNSIYNRDTQDLHKGEIPGTNIKIMATPGHMVDHGSLVVPVNSVIYVVAGDVFWWAEDEEEKTDRHSLLSKKDPIEGVDDKILLESRKKILEIADCIIPGHGKMFKT